MAKEHLGHLNQDLLAEILSRLDGPTLAAAACSCSDLRRVAREERFLPSSCLQKRPKSSRAASHVSPSDFVSFVDVYYKKKCIFSKVLHGISGTDDSCDEGDGNENFASWFLDCPFRIDVLNYQRGSTAVDDDGFDDGQDVQDHDEVTMASLPSIPMVEKKERGNSKFCRKLEKNVRLSWVLLNTKTGKAVNLSSWKPILVQRHWPSESDFLMRFGCVVQVEEQLLPRSSAECVISVRCRLLEREGCLRWTEISMQVEDMEGAHVSGRTGIMLLEGALRCERSRHNWEVEMGYGEYMREKREVVQKKMKNEGFADMLCLFSGIALLGSLCFLVL
ncbi:putative F-box protein [Cinnamomum micranthum f. kanehirae]|uniref:Putative F-box protein n=1 Tax=Cinnamomum micranthum f. kanehirae TaxID=337451 RepID=A0A3S3QMZ8_9MAGN|nr:putative F-box protein [Cinnamomum micranthum f. kanehirae]